MITAFRLSRFFNLLKSRDAEGHRDLIEKTVKSGNLYTYTGRERTVTEIPGMDREMIRRSFQKAGLSAVNALP
jgi:hypothetical protein